jgi:hypothetical protein
MNTIAIATARRLGADAEREFEGERERGKRPVGSGSVRLVSPIVEITYIP